MLRKPLTVGGFSGSLRTITLGETNAREQVGGVVKLTYGCRVLLGVVRNTIFHTRAPLLKQGGVFEYLLSSSGAYDSPSGLDSRYQ
jgi:hypothetical protein